MIGPPLLLGAGLTLLTVVCHILGLVHLGRLLSYLLPKESVGRHSIHRVLFLSVAVLLMITLHFLGAGAWALVFCWVGEFDSFSDALYFSVVTGTTLGYGDVTMSEAWRVLALFEAMTGLLLFGASTAAVFQLMVRTLPDPFENQIPAIPNLKS
ncbi:MAG: potassium channel family protein [Acidobacteriota bacterium]